MSQVPQTKPVEPEVWLVIDTHTKTIVGSCKTLRQASRSCDRRDLAYGAVRYTYRRAGERA